MNWPKRPPQRRPACRSRRAGRPLRRRPGAYWRLLMRGAVLLAVTLGIYRFWFATDMRRFLWSNTEIAGETLEYTGTAIELLIGFLIAIALLVPLYVGFFRRGAEPGPDRPARQRAAAFRCSPSSAISRSIAPAAIASPAPSIAACAAIRTARPGATRVCALFWWTLIILTLGLVYPFAQSSLERFKMRHTYYGNLKGRFRRLRLAPVPARPADVALGDRAAGLCAGLCRSPPWNGTRWRQPPPAASSGDEFINQLESALSERLCRHGRWRSPPSASAWRWRRSCFRCSRR